MAFCEINKISTQTKNKKKTQITIIRNASRVIIADSIEIEWILKGMMKNCISTNLTNCMK
jgi:hypothetical protein